MNWNKSGVESRIEGIAWGLFFLWVGIAFLTDLSNGIGLLGVGVITLGAQLIRKSYGFEFEGFWLVVGLGFTLGGLWEFMDPGIALVPVLLIIAGLALLYSVWKGSRPKISSAQ
ncbi:MAG: hypothetical protein OEQ81_09375 [Flavobacteriaceae bacterium]|nr:hypothetical protein [Flavobacteriaceae bacterium]